MVFSMSWSWGVGGGTSAWMPPWPGNKQETTTPQHLCTYTHVVISIHIIPETNKKQLSWLYLDGSEAKLNGKLRLHLMLTHAFLDARVDDLGINCRSFDCIAGPTDCE